MSSTSRCEPTVAVGIDLGTAYSSVGIFRNGRVEFTWTIPSYVAFTEYGCVVGEGAKHLAAIQYPNTEVVFGAKRLLGRGSGSLLEMQRFPFDVVDDKVHPSVKVKVKGKTRVLSSVQICSMILSKLKRAAESHLGHIVRDAVITVPAYFNFTQRQAVIDAVTISGLNMLRVVSNVGAAGLTYALEKKISWGAERNVLFFDLGAGGLSVAVMTLEGGVVDMKSIAGDPNIGGADFDNRMVTHFIQEFNQKFGSDLGQDKKAVSRLKTYCEKAKEALSRSRETMVEIDSLSQGVNFSTQMSRARFEALNADLFKSTLDPVEKALCDSGFAQSKIDDIVLTGGSTHIPAIQKLLQDYFSAGKRFERADDLVVRGAAMYAAMMNGDTTKEVQETLILEVSPIAIGIETDGNVMSKIISRNKNVPCICTNSFTFESSPKKGIAIKIFEGESASTKFNYLLRELTLANILPGDREVELTFVVDRSFVLNVSAVDKITGREYKITVTNDRGRLRAEEIERMISEADDYSDEEGALENQQRELQQLLQIVQEAEKRATDANQNAKEILRTAHDAEERAQEAHLPVEDAERRVREATHRAEEADQRAQETTRDAEVRRLQETTLDAERRVQEATRRAEDAEQRAQETTRDAERRIQEATQDAERKVQEATHRAEEANERALATSRDAGRKVQEATQDAERIVQEATQDADRRVQEAVNRAEEADQRVQEATHLLEEAEEEVRQFETQWAVQRDEIVLTREELGRGGWAAVKVANFRGTRVAAKCFYQQILVSAYNRQLFNREMNMAARLRHPNLVQFIGATLDGEPIILTELMPTSLRTVLESGPISESDTISISLDVARALNYLHLMKPDPIIHRDISSANVLLERMADKRFKAKVSDYGSVNVLQKLQTVGPGSPVYAAPEANTPGLQSPKMDIFSFGILLVEMLTDQFPEENKRRRLIHSIKNQPCLNLIRRCLDQQRDRRPSAVEIITVLSAM